MDMLPNVTAFRSTSSGHHSPSLELSLGWSSPSLEMSYCGALIGRRWYTSRSWHTEQAGKFTERQPFTSGADSGVLRAQRSICCKASDCSCFPSQQSRNASSSSSFLWFRLWNRQHPPHHHGLTLPQRTPNRSSPMAHFARSVFLRPHNFQHPSPLGADFGGSSIDVSFGSAICSNVTNASTAETVSVSFTLPFPSAFAWFVTRFNEDFLAVPDFQAVQFSVFTFHRFVTTGMMVAVFITQISHHHWSKAAGTAIDTCHNVSLYFVHNLGTNVVGLSTFSPGPWGT